MKKRNLFLSLMCSIILTVALVAVTVVSVVVPKRGNGPVNPSTNVSNRYEPQYDESENENRDGSAENPYVLFDAKSFVDMLTEEGAFEEGVEGKNFEVTNDIDFTDVDFVTLFGQGKSFAGHIDGKGHSLDNITIHVTKENICDFAYQTRIEDLNKVMWVSNVGIFGNTLNAEIKDLKVNNLQINVDDELYPYVADAEFAVEHERAFRQLTIGSLVATAISTDIEGVEVNSKINGSAYSIYVDGTVAGYNAVGGLVGVLSDSTVSASKAKVELVAEDEYTGNYFVGGVAGYAYDSNIEAADVALDVKANYAQRMYIGGVVGYADGTSVTGKELPISDSEETEFVDTVVVLNVSESNPVQNDQKLFELTQSGKVTFVAGVAVTVVADEISDTCEFSDIDIKASVDMNCYYAGVIYETTSGNVDFSKNYSLSEYYVTIKGIITDSNVNVLKAYGLGKDIVANLDLTKAESVGSNMDGYAYNIKITGNVSQFVALANSMSATNRYINVKSAHGWRDVQLAISGELVKQLKPLDSIRFTIHEL